MGFRGRRSIKILPGIRWNIGKKSGSLSIGGRGATVNFSKRGTRTTLSVPGTGLSYTTTSPRKTAAKASGTVQLPADARVSPEPKPPALGWAVARLVVFFGMVAIVVRLVWLAIQ